MVKVSGKLSYAYEVRDGVLHYMFYDENKNITKFTDENGHIINRKDFNNEVTK
jgi:hypothetical protein